MKSHLRTRTTMGDRSQVREGDRPIFTGKRWHGGEHSSLGRTFVAMKMRQSPACERLPATVTGHPSRRGAVLTVVMICLLICSMVLGSILTLQIRLNHQLEREEAAQQADLFAQAGLERALIRLKADPEYRREEWKPSAGKVVGFVKIEVVPSPNTPQEYKIQIAARFPADVENSPQRLREVTVQRSF